MNEDEAADNDDEEKEDDNEEREANNGRGAEVEKIFCLLP